MTYFDFSPLLFLQVIAMLSYFCFGCLFIRGGSALCVSPQISGTLHFSAKLCQITIPNFYGCSSWFVDDCCRWRRFDHVRSRFEDSYKPASCRFALFLFGSFRASLIFKDASVLGMGFEILGWIMNRDSLLSESQ